jgi:hypothetical protein
MVSLNHGTTWILIWMVAGVGLAENRTPQSTSPDRQILSRVVEMPQSDGMTTTEAYGLALSAAGVPGGIVLARGWADQTKHKWRPSTDSLARTLDSVVTLDPEYMWKIEDGVVNLIPARGEPALLDVRIAHFHVKPGTDPRNALQQLLQMPEVRARMRQLNLSYPVFSALQGAVRMAKPGVRSAKTETQGEVHCKNVALRVALNAIVRAHGRAVWSYSEVPTRGPKELHVDLLVQ